MAPARATTNLSRSSMHKRARTGVHRPRRTQDASPASHVSRCSHVSHVRRFWQQNPRASLQPPLSLPLALLLKTFFLASFLAVASAQQQNPLAGQGTSPCAGGFDDYCHMPVYVSVELQRLQSIDEKDYEFKAILNLEQTWTDPRADSVWLMIEERDLFVNSSTSARNGSLYSQVVDCFGGNSSGKGVNLSSSGCEEAQRGPPDCKRFCTMHGLTTSNPYRCCDLVWLPEIRMNNLIDTTQDRVVYDTIFPFTDVITNRTWVHRTTRVQGRYYSALDFHDYPFDKQELQVLFDGNLRDSTDFQLVPSATFRHLNPQIKAGAEGSLDISGLAHDELAGWSINNVTFNCTNVAPLASQDGVDSTDINYVLLWKKVQDYNADDPYFHYRNSRDASSESELLRDAGAVCSLSVFVSRLSNTLTAQSILPVSFVGLLAFVVFFSAPDMLDFRLGTEITLFLALTAVQFVFVSILPVASYLTAFDIFILLTYCVIVVIIIENLIVYYISTREAIEERRSRARSMQLPENVPMFSDRSVARTKSMSMQKANAGAQPEPSVAVTETLRERSTRSMRPMGSSLKQVSEEAGALEVKIPGHNGSSLEEAGDVESGKQPSEVGLSQATRTLESDPAPSAESSWSRFQISGNMLVPVNAMKPVQLLHETDSKFAHDSGFAYRVSRGIDRAAGVTLFFIYALLSILNFTVGFN